MSDSNRPHHRSDFEIAVICALQVEIDAVEAFFDQFWEDDKTYRKTPGDFNTYNTGRLGHHNVVLAYMPGMGKSTASAVGASFRSSFGGIKLGLVVGVCGGVPIGTDKEKEVLLGDVIISTGAVQVDFGRQFSNKVARKDTLADNLGRPNTEIRAFLAKMRGLRSRTQLTNGTFVYLTELCQKKGFERSGYPGAEEYKLYELTYRHKHHETTVCAICAKCEKPANL
jgi:Phosphorylase superfamily